MQWTRYVACTGEMIKPYQISVSKSETKRSTVTHERGWEDNTKMYLKDIKYAWVLTDTSGSRYGTVEDFLNIGMRLRVP